MARLLAYFLFFIISCRSTRAAECSAECSTEFTDKCWTIQCKSKNGEESHTACRGQIDAGAGILMTKGCDKACTDTSAMLAKKTATCAAGSGTASKDTTGYASSGGTTDYQPGVSVATCETATADKPSEPTLCTTANAGCCNCGTTNTQTFVFWSGTKVQHCFHVYNLPATAPSAGPLPVLLHMDGYSGGKFGSDNQGGMGTAAKYYGFTTITLNSLLKDGAGGFGLEFPNDGVANDANPVPCSASDSRDMAYLEAVFKFIADRSTLLESSKVFTEGFSQNSMFAIYVAVCFADKVAGAWQGGSGMAKTAHTPTTPGAQAQCTRTSNAIYATDCCASDFCTDCKYWPVYPKTCANKIVDCLMTYVNDKIGCGTDWYMYEAMVQEGNDARLLSFPDPGAGHGGGHTDPKNPWAWKVGCLGIVQACSSACATSFSTCVDGDSAATNYLKFESCEGQIKAGSLSDCVVGCAPTLTMLQKSENALVTLSEGKFGTDTSLTKQTGSAPKPVCDFGTFQQFPVKCTAPSTYVFGAESPKACSALPDGAAGRAARAGNSTTGTNVSGSQTTVGAVISEGNSLRIGSMTSLFVISLLCSGHHV